MFQKNRLSGVILILVSLVLIVIALKSVSGALSQWTASLTAGQQLEKVIHFICGVLSLLILIGIWGQAAFYSLHSICMGHFTSINSCVQCTGVGLSDGDAGYCFRIIFYQNCLWFVSNYQETRHSLGLSELSNPSS